MQQLVLLVVAAAWAAVLIPPLLRSRIENRPNSSVTDFRRKLNRLQSTVPTRASGPMRGMARPLAQSPLQRPAASGRPGVQPAQMRRGGTRAHGTRTLDAPSQREMAPRRRSHGDPTGGQPRPPQHRDPRRRQQPQRVAASGGELQRRRSNVLFMLVLAAASTLFLAATTKEPVMLYLFVGAFLALCGYLYLLAQVRQRQTTSWPNDWMQGR